MDAFKYLTFILTVSLFYSFGITVLSYGLSPMYSNSQITDQYISIRTDMTNVSGQIEGTVRNQINIPLIDLGALVFYSGNIILDLMLNFLFAIPGMFTLLISSFLIIFSLDAYLATQLKLFLFTLISIMYFLSLLAFVMNIRSGGRNIV